MKIIGLVGTRKRNGQKDFDLAKKTFAEHYEEGDVICSGLCPKGADQFALIISQTYDVPSLWYPAEWKKYGKSAGFKRNTDIAKKSDILIAMVSEDRKGGTEDTIKKFVGFHGGQNLIII